MSDTVIKVENLSKKYILGHQREKGYTTLRDSIANGAKDLLKPFQRHGKSQGADPTAEEFWALKDVSFEIKQGDRVGIIGRNGSGKSTLLKILSRITEPTTGRISIKGRVASLLEVGTGFHPELTGRENIYLNGAILGMSKVEIKNKFDEIVTFAEIEKFLDTPVKRYSSGMYVRLAFAVASHLEPEILIVDEVLAVGDAKFQKKCLRKLGEGTKDGRTTLFVSHNLLAVENLCDRVVWMNNGEIAGRGNSRQVIHDYIQASLSTAVERVWTEADALGTKEVRLHRVAVCPDRPHSSTQGAIESDISSITVHTSLLLEFEYWNFDPTAHLSVSLGLYNAHDILIFDIASPFEPEWQQNPSAAGLLRTVCHIPGDFLNDGLHRIDLVISRNHIPVIKESEALLFQVQDGSVAERGGWYGKWPGVIRPMFEWETNRLISLSLTHSL